MKKITRNIGSTMVESKNGITKPHKTHTHTQTNAHTDTILKTFLWALASCFTGFVRAFPNSIDLWRCLITGEEKIVKRNAKSHKEKVHEIMEATAPIYYMYVCMYFHIFDNGQCGDWSKCSPKIKSKRQMSNNLRLLTSPGFIIFFAR